MAVSISDLTLTSLVRGGRISTAVSRTVRNVITTALT